MKILRGASEQNLISRKTGKRGEKKFKKLRMKMNSNATKLYIYIYLLTVPQSFFNFSSNIFKSQALHLDSLSKYISNFPIFLEI